MRVPWRRGAALLVLGASLGGCKDKPADAPPPPPPHRTAELPRPHLPPGNRFDVLPQTRPLTPQPVTVDEVAALVPTIPGGAVLGPPKTVADGLQVHLTWCVPAADPAAAARVIDEAMTAATWNNVVTRGQGATIGVVGDRPPFRLSALVTAERREGCSPDNGRYVATATIHKLVVAPSPLGGVRAPAAQQTQP
jgi:hypothetical protein